MNYTSKFDGLSSEFLLILTNLKDKSKKYPSLRNDLIELQVFYDAAANLFALADAEAVTAQVRITLAECEKRDVEKTMAALAHSLLVVDPESAREYLEELVK